MDKNRDTTISPSYILSEVKNNWNDWDWWGTHIQARINEPIQRWIRPPSDSIDILDEKWDTLIIIDACRADLFDRISTGLTFDTETTVMSPASSTEEWLRYTFGQIHGDIVYVAGNPMVSRHRPEAFHELIEAWRHGYDSNTSVIRPEAITTAAQTARAEFPNKRLIVHYMQPHYPFIDYPELNYANYGFEDVGLEKNPQHTHGDIDGVWQALEAGLVDADSVWKGYEHNLEVVMEEVETFVKSTDDQIVLTSDHGNMFGGRSFPIPIRVYGHPSYKRLKPLIQVPFGIVKGERRNIVSEETTSSSSATTQEVQEQLSALGYR